MIIVYVYIYIYKYTHINIYISKSCLTICDIESMPAVMGSVGIEQIATAVLDLWEPLSAVG